MKIPQSGRKKALIIVDVQPAFVKPAGRFAIPNIQKLISGVSYDAYIEVLFYSDRDSQWARQTDSTLHPRDKDFYTLPEVASLLKSKALHIEKNTKSAFKGDQDLKKIFADDEIEEIHLVGYDTDDCVMATANEAFDLGYFIYVIEECTASSSGNGFREKALTILRNLNLTNNSCIEKIEFTKL